MSEIARRDESAPESVEIIEAEIVYADEIAIPEKSRVWGLWYGGASYSSPYLSEHLEVFDSLEDAKESLVSRYETGYWFRQYFGYVHKEATEDLTPVVTEDSEMMVYLAEPSLDDPDPYPDIQLTLHINEDGGATAVANPC